MIEQLNYNNYVQNNKARVLCTSYTKINSKWVKDLNFRPEAIKLLEENIGRTLYNINNSKILYEPPHRVMEIKTKMNKWDLIKLKRFWTMKKIISKVKSQPSEWEKRNNNETTDKELLFSKIYKQPLHLKTRKKNNPIKKGAKYLNSFFFQKETYIWLINT